MTWSGLTVSELREHVTTELEDPALQRLLDGTRDAILWSFGGAPPGLDTVSGGQSYIFLRYPATAVVSVTETDDANVATVLDPSAYWLRDDRVSLLRTGDRVWWGSPVQVEYTTPDIDAALDLAQLALVELELNHNPGVTGETIGSWSEQSNSGTPYTEERDEILASVPGAGPPPPGFA